MNYTNKLSGKALKSDLNKALREYEKWRRDRPNRGLIPDYLWELAVNLCRRYSINQVVKALHLNYNALKKRVENSQAGSAHKKGKRNREKEITRFIDLTAPGARLPFHSPSDNIIIEYQKTDGNNLKIHIPHVIDFNLPEIISFLSGERSS